MFLKQDTKSTDYTEKIDKSDNVEVKILCLSKDTIKRVKKQVTVWKKIFIIHVPINEFRFRIYKENIINSIEK